MPLPQAVAADDLQQVMHRPVARLEGEGRQGGQPRARRLRSAPIAGSDASVDVSARLGHGGPGPASSLAARPRLKCTPASSVIGRPSVPAPLQLRANGLDDRLGLVEGRGASLLHGEERPGIRVGLDPGKRAHQLRPSHSEPDPPPGHGEALGEREELERDIARPRYLEDAWRAITVEGQIAVGVIVSEQDVVTTAEGNRPLEVISGRDGRGRIVRIVDEHQFGAPEDGLGHLLQIQEEVVLRTEGRDVRIGAGQMDPPRYAWYPGSGTIVASPGLTTANGRWDNPSFEPMSGRVSVIGSNRSPNRRSTHREAACRKAGRPC